MTTIYLIRHAEAEGNLYRIAQGQANSSITDRGERQIQALARRFADIPIDAVYASDLYRTCATASAIYKPKGLPLHRRRDLREICVGVWEEKTWGEIARQDPAQLEKAAAQADCVVNTAPALVVTRGVLEALQPGTLVVDLASEPGGTDFAAARALGVRAMHALSLPARFAPETAGELVGRTVLQMIREREEGA